MTRDQWLVSFAAASGARPPTPTELNDLLKLAGVAAHASERTAAPLTCWMAARSGMPLDRLLATAERLAEERVHSSSEEHGSASA